MNKPVKSTISGGVYTLDEVLELTKLRKTKLYELMAAGLAPQRVKYPTAKGDIGVTNTSYWFAQEWQDWLADRKAARDAELQKKLSSGVLQSVWFPGRTLPNEPQSGSAERGVQ